MRITQIQEKNVATALPISNAPELPGIGFEGKSDLYREMQSLSN
jgi:hypothetical protein